MATYRGVIHYAGDETGAKVTVRKYEWAENALILHFGTVTEIVPYHAFTKASFDALPDKRGGGGSTVIHGCSRCRPCSYTCQGYTYPLGGGARLAYFQDGVQLTARGETSTFPYFKAQTCKSPCHN